MEILKKNTLLSKFLKEKMQQQSEDFSNKKHNASILSITSLPQKEIADNLNQSYGVLRQWNMQALFKSYINNYCRLFAYDFISHCYEKGKKLEETLITLYENLLRSDNDDNSILKFYKSYPEINFDEIIDSRLYGYKLCNEIIKLYRTYIEDSKVISFDISSVISFISVYKIVSQYLDLLDEVKKSSSRLLNEINNSLNDNCRMILLHKEIDLGYRFGISVKQLLLKTIIKELF